MSQQERRNRRAAKSAQAAPKIASRRCDEVYVTLLVRTFDEKGNPNGEHAIGAPQQDGTVAPMKLFRANAEDFWAEVDKAVAVVHAKAQAQG